jgi:pSer/pThr/pTyr-binding forkhead associated (FHA) protein
MVKEATLTYENPNGEERVLGLDGEVFRIGRYEGNDLAFDNPYISRYHAEITVHGSAYQIRDLASTSGTFVNGERVKQRNLKDGDSISLGRARGIKLVFHGDSSDEEAPANTEDTLQPVHVVTPENTRFLDTSRLPNSGELTGETVDSLRALYEFMS